MSARISPAWVLVTGTSTGIGAALARALLAAGWTVTGVARRRADIDHERYRHVEADLGDAAALADLMRDVVAPALREPAWRRIGLVNNAAVVGALRSLPGLEPRDLAEVLAVNVTAPVALMAHLLREAPADVPLRLVNISSGAAHLPIPGLVEYCASKAALRAAGRTAAAELEADARDAAILSYEPGVVDTPMQDRARDTDPARFPSHETFRGFRESGALVAPDRVTGPIVDFLEGDPISRFTELRYDGG